jgi:hypothetical protein
MVSQMLKEEIPYSNSFPQSTPFEKLKSSAMLHCALQMYRYPSLETVFPASPTSLSYYHFKVTCICSAFCYSRVEYFTLVQSASERLGKPKFQCCCLERAGSHQAGAVVYNIHYVHARTCAFILHTF